MESTQEVTVITVDGREIETLPLVIAQSEPDCDGIGYNWKRVQLPAKLVKQWLELRQRRAQSYEQDKERFLDEARKAGCGERFIESVKQHQSRFRIPRSEGTAMLDGMMHGIVEGMEWWSLTYEIDNGSSLDGAVMSIDEFMERVWPDMDEHDREWWQQEGYHGVFYAR